MTGYTKVIPVDEKPAVRKLDDPVRGQLSDLKGRDEKYPNEVRGRNQAPEYPLLGLSL